MTGFLVSMRLAAGIALIAVSGHGDACSSCLENSPREIATVRPRVEERKKLALLHPAPLTKCQIPSAWRHALHADSWGNGACHD